MTTTGLLWLFLIASLVLVGWLMVRFPNLGPTSIQGALIACLFGLAAPKIGLAVLPLVLRIPYGLQTAFLCVILPVFAVMFLTIGWLMRACAKALGGPRGGHPVRQPGGSST